MFKSYATAVYYMYVGCGRFRRVHGINRKVYELHMRDFERGEVWA